MIDRALSSTIRAANIVGVPAAIMFGEPGVVFWMWVIALIGMALKFAESVLAVEYREKNSKGEFVGGPMYYMTNGHQTFVHRQPPILHHRRLYVFYMRSSWAFYCYVRQ